MMTEPEAAPIQQPTAEKRKIEFFGPGRKNSIFYLPNIGQKTS
jgi:hypothetical protein